MDYWSGNVQIAAESCLVIGVSHTYGWWDSWRSMYMSQSVCLTQSISRTLAKQHYIKFFGLQGYHMTPYIKPYCKAALISFKCTCIGHVLVWVIKTIMNDQTPTVLWTIRVIIYCKLQASTIHCKVWQEQHCGAIHFECLSILGLPKKSMPLYPW